MRTAFVGAIVCFVLACSPSFAAEPFADFDKYVDEVIADWKIPGLSVAVVTDGKTSFLKGFGKRSVDSDDPVDEHTVFAIGSLTKSFTASLCAQLVAEKKIRWDDHAGRWLKDLVLYDPWISQECSLRDLLAHRTGINDPGYLWWGSGLDSQEMLKRMRHVRGNGPFRAKYAYNNIFYMAAGECIGEAAGKPWSTLVKERLFLPLSMNESTTSTKDIVGYANLAKPHKLINGKVKEIPYRNLDQIASAGAINSSAHDMARWLGLHVNEGKFGDNPIIANDVLTETHSAQMLMGNPPPLSEYLRNHVVFAGYCLGWVTGSYRGHRILWHVGAVDGMNAVMGISPEKKCGVVILANMDQRDQVGIFAVFLKTLDCLLGLEPEDWKTKVREVFERKEEKRKLAWEEAAAEFPKGTKPTFPLETYAGKYENRVYGPFEIKHEGGRLVAKLGSVSGKLFHRHLDTFKFVDDGRVGDTLDFTFVIDEKAKIEAVRNDDLGWYSKEAPKPDAGAATKGDIKPKPEQKSNPTATEQQSDRKPEQTSDSKSEPKSDAKADHNK